MKSNFSGLKKKGRHDLVVLFGSNSELITIAFAARALNVDRQTAQVRLASLARSGWLARVRRGIYLKVPMHSLAAEIFPQDPRLIAEEVFSPCYISGLSAAIHWRMTEQSSNLLFIITNRQVHKRDLGIGGNKLLVKTVSSHKFFGTKPIWIGRTKIELSDPTKTILDCLDDPKIAGGVRNLIQLLESYFRSHHKDLQLLKRYAEKILNGAIYKRLGYLLETTMPLEEEIIDFCRKQMKTGYSQLDPSLPGKKLITCWRLLVPENFMTRV
jgi:predicted transcriptional regulator of viral defense system